MKGPDLFFRNHDLNQISNNNIISNTNVKTKLENLESPSAAPSNHVIKRMTTAKKENAEPTVAKLTLRKN